MHVAEIQQHSRVTHHHHTHARFGCSNGQTTEREGRVPGRRQFGSQPDGFDLNAGFSNNMKAAYWN